MYATHFPPLSLCIVARRLRQTMGGKLDLLRLAFDGPNRAGDTSATFAPGLRVDPARAGSSSTFRTFVVLAPIADHPHITHRSR